VAIAHATRVKRLRVESIRRLFSNMPYRIVAHRAGLEAAASPTEGAACLHQV